MTMDKSPLSLEIRELANGQIAAIRSYDGDQDAEAKDLALFCSYFCKHREQLIKVAAGVVASTTKDHVEIVAVFQQMKHLSHDLRVQMLKMKKP